MSASPQRVIIPARWLRCCLAAFLLATIAACASNPPVPVKRSDSTALADYTATSLGRAHAKIEAQHPGLSGFSLLRYGRDAFNTRIRLIDIAEKTIDVQVYIWEGDETGRIFAERLIRAADRGVRVRALIDDLGTNASDSVLAAMDAHPNIELRLFNPFANRSTPALDFLTDLKRVNHRMHNKIFIVDNSAAIVGGRNMGDHYFGVNQQTNFRDLDMGAVGPVVRDASELFDYFWRGEWSVPIAAIAVAEDTSFSTQAFATRIREEIVRGSYPYKLEEDLVALDSQLAAIEDRYVWASGAIVWDDPAAMAASTTGDGDIVQKLRQKLLSLEKSLTIESAYFVPGDGGVEQIRALVDRGVSVRILTNSLASNDVLAAHAGHAEYRRALLEAGAEIYELRPDSAVIKKTWLGDSRAGLHTKALLFDDEAVFVGSFNLDPRSASINTEAGIYAEHPVLARQLRQYMDDGVTPQNSYRVALDDDDSLVWITQNDGVEVRYHQDPLSTFWQRFAAGFIALLPLESQL